MLRKSVVGCEGLWNHVVLCNPEMFTSLARPTSVDEAPCSTAGYNLSFHVRFVSTHFLKSLRGKVFLRIKSGTDSDNVGVPLPRINPSTSNSSVLTLSGSAVRAKHVICRKCPKCCRTKFNSAAAASRPLATGLCDATATRGEEPRGECRGEDTFARSLLGHISVDMAMWSLRTRCGLNTWHIKTMPMIRMSRQSSFFPKMDCCNTENTCQ
mmetsp:Transcript_28960/g.76412  ORF Transcript_28960/g.76412 Transcript_28960/m.76412 type:complete len:211 (-) Transcript_28960:252-884(-)